MLRVRAVVALAVRALALAKLALGIDRAIRGLANVADPSFVADIRVHGVFSGFLSRAPLPVTY